jgi:hypothetical protein
VTAIAQGAAIPSAEVFGAGTQQVIAIAQGSAIPSAEVFGAGTQSVVAPLQGSAIPSDEVFGAGTRLVTAIAQGAAIPSAEVFGAGTQQVIAIAQGSAIASGELFGAGTQAVTAPLQGAAIPSAEVFGAGTAGQPISVQGVGYPGDEVFGAGTIYIFQTETVSLLGRFGGSYTYAQQVAKDALIAGLKTDSLWSTIDVLHIPAGSATQADALLNWKSSSYNLSITGSLTYTTGRNFSGFTTSNYLSDGFVPSSAGGNFVQNSATFGVYSLGDGASSNTAMGGTGASSTNYCQIVLKDGSNRVSGISNSSSSQTVGSTNSLFTAVGLTTNSRTASNVITLYRNSTSQATGSTASTGNSAVQLYIGCLNSNGTAINADTNLVLAADVKASGWTGTQVSNFYSRLNTYLQTLKQTSYALTYSSDGDSNGLFYLLGTNTGMQAWANPAYNVNPSSDGSYANNAAIVLSASTIGSGSLNTLCDRTTSSFYTSNVASSWVKADIGKFRSLSVNKYSIRNYPSSADSLRSWKLQGSNDNSTWTDLDVRTNDTTFNAANVWYSITPNQGVSTAFQFFRILNTGLTSSSSNYLCLGEWELYGTLTVNTQSTFSYVANGDQNGILYYLASTQAAENWCNGWVHPHATGQVTVSASSINTGNVSMLVNRAQNVFSTNNSAGSWVQLDFGASRTVRVDAYQLRNYNGGSNLLRNWKIQGSNNGSTWTDLDARTSDATFTTSSQWGYWTANQGNTSYWRYIRLLSTGVDSGSANYISLGQIELYGAIA